MTELRVAVNDGLIMTWRNLKRVPRIPELAIFAILQSIMFVLLFAYVFGGAIPLPGGGSYREYLMPGIYIQTLGFASITTAIAVTDDMAKGLIDRFRSLPMARSAVLSGRTFSDVIYNVGILVVLMLSGLVVGWRVHTGVGDFLLAVLLMLYFTYAMAWIGVLIGLLVPSVEVGQQLGFLIVFPLTFVSNAFVPTESLPGWLQPVAEWNPFSALTAATRDLFGNPNPFTSGFPGEHPILLSLLWTTRAARRLRTTRGAEVPLDRSLGGEMEDQPRAPSTVWALGDYHRFAKQMVWGVGPELVEACGIESGQSVLDVGAGTGNVAIRAAEAGANVVACDVTPESLAAGEREARERGVDVEWVVADAQALPFADGEFDVVTSSFGAMFAPDHQAVADELLRVCRPGGTIGMANFTPEGGVGEFFGVFAPYLPAPPPDALPPLLWGDEGHVQQLFGDRVASLGLDAHLAHRAKRRRSARVLRLLP